MDQFVRDLVTGSVSGGIYALIAAGLVLTYATTGIFNLGYAGIAFSSAFVFFELNTGLHWPQLVAAGAVILVYCPVLGLLLDVAIFRRLARAPEVAQIVATVGVLLALPALCTFLLGRGITEFGWSIPTGTDVQLATGLGPQPREVYRLFSGVVITSDQIIVLVTALLCVGALAVFLRYTNTGLRMRAVADRHDLASLRGVNDARTSQLAWVLGTMLAGVAGVVGSPILRSIDPNTYSLAVFVAIAAAVVGGFRSVGLAFVGAIFVAVASNLTFSYATFAESIPGFNSTVPFLLLIAGLVLMARSRARVAGSIAAEPPAPDYQRDLPRWRRMLLPVLGCVALVYLVFSLLGTYWLGLTTRGLIFSLIFLSFTIVTGVGGMVSLAQAAFVSGAGLLAGALITRFDLPWGIAALGAVVASMALGVLVALPSLRLGGVALALATLALAFVGGMVVFQIDWIRNGEFGWTYTRPVLGPFHLDDTRTMAAFLMLLIAAVVLLIRNLERSTSGREMLAVRNAPAAAASIGISPTATKLKVFALSAGVAGLGGVLLATNDLSFTSSSINPTVGLLWLAGVVLLGIRKPAGAIAAGLVYTLMPGLLGGFTLPFDLAHWSGTRAAEVPIILFGLGAIALARQPDGIFQEVAKKNYERRERRRRRRDATSSTVDAAPNALDQTDRVVPRRVGARERRVTMPKLEVRGLDVSYGPVQVVHDLALSLTAGSITTVLGPNGAGKSTTCQALAGLLPARAGTIEFDGVDITRRPAWWRARRGIVLVPEGRGIFPGLSVEDNLRLVLTRSAERDEVYERFPVLGERRRQQAGSLSGGEQQMLSLAPMLVHETELLIADEPALGLAPRIVEQILGIFTELRDRGTTVLLVGESPQGIIGIADQAMLLHVGHVTWAGAASDLDQATLEESYFGAARDD